jgi:uncharacterized membrane protein YkvA (DUF1232 family)
MPSFREIGRRIRSEIAFYRRVLSHPGTPRLARFLLGAAVAYLLTPIDLIPDFIPVVGHLDDILIMPGLIWLAFRLIPADVVEACRFNEPNPIDSSN